MEGEAQLKVSIRGSEMPVLVQFFATSPLTFLHPVRKQEVFLWRNLAWKALLEYPGTTEATKRVSGCK